MYGGVVLLCVYLLTMTASLHHSRGSAVDSKQPLEVLRIVTVKQVWHHRCLEGWEGAFLLMQWVVEAEAVGVEAGHEAASTVGRLQ